MKQAFFDGPFSLSTEDKAEASDPLHLGFRKLIEFDDREAERYFREALQFPRNSTQALLGLAQVNSDDPRRVSCFLGAADEQLNESEAELLLWHQFLTQSILRSTPTDLADFIALWKKAALESENPYLALSLARQVILSASGGESTIDGQEILSELVEAAPMLEQFPLLTNDASAIQMGPQWLRLQAEEHLLSGEFEAGIERLLASIGAERHRLERNGLLMPQASLRLGDSSERLLRLLEKNHQEEATLIASSLMELPRDPFSIGKKWRRLRREKTPWVVGRTARARIAIQEKDWNALAALPRGFSSRDKSEWFLWQIVAAAESGSDANLWLAALRREREGKDLLLGAENYLHWKLEGEWLEKITLPGLPDREESSNLSAAIDASVSVRLPQHFLAPIKDAATAFSLPDWRNHPVQLTDYENGPLLVIFFLGGGCLHCVEQLTAFGPWASQYEESGIPILAVSTDPVEILTETISGETAAGSSYPIPIVSDEKLSVFQEWGVYDAFDGRAIHATFLLNSDHEIIWMEKGNAPYMHPDFLLHESKRLLEL